MRVIIFRIVRVTALFRALIYRIKYFVNLLILNFYFEFTKLYNFVIPRAIFYLE